MFNVGLLIKQYLLSNPDIVTKFDKKIFNLFVDYNESINPPYLAIILDSYNPTYTKDIFLFNEIQFTTTVISNKYPDLISLCELVKATLEFKSISDDKIEISNIEFINYQEAAIEGTALYTGSIQFSCKVSNK